MGKYLDTRVSHVKLLLRFCVAFFLTIYRHSILKASFFVPLRHQLFLTKKTKTVYI